jgi:hypothetical protein
MKTHAKPIVALATGVILLCGVVCQTVQAQLVLGPLTPGGPADTGTSILADSSGSGPTSPESLTVTWAVSENVADVYTYAYQVYNPPGDVLLGGPDAGQAEIVDSFSVLFDTTDPSLYIPGTQSAGSGNQVNGTSGLFWTFPAVNPGGLSPGLSFESLEPPTSGNANAQDGNPPSPWSSSPSGQEVPVPIPEPASMTLLALSALSLLMRKGQKTS